MTALYFKDLIKFDNCGCLPKMLRILVSGASNNGKTSLVLNFLLNTCPIHNKKYIDWNCLIVVSKSLFQNEYKTLILGIKNNLNK